MMLPLVLVLNLAVLAAVLLLLRDLREMRRLGATQRDRQRVRRLEDLLGTIPDPLIVLDRDGRYLEEYPASSQRRARSILDQLRESDRTTLNQQLTAAIDGQRRVQQRFLTQGRTFIADIWPLRFPTQHHAAAVCLRDVTEQENSLSELNKLSARNRAILRSAMDGFFVVNEEFRFLDVNEAFCGMVGYTADELLHIKITDLEVPEAAGGGADSSPLRTGLHQFATAHRHKDGHIIRLETSVIVLRDDGRKILVGFARDVTERLRAEEALERLSRQNQLILDSAGEGICGVDMEGRFTFANPAAGRMLGWQVPELIGQCAHGLLRQGRAVSAACTRDDCIICRALQDGSAQHTAAELFCRKDGTFFPAECVSSSIREHGKLTGAVVVFLDVSERKRAEEEHRQLEARFQQAQKLESLGMLAGGLAHDFNNLLLRILCNASLATECVPQDSEVRPQLEKIVKAGRRASELTRQMLVYSGQASYDVQPVDLNELVEEIADLVGAALPKLIRLSLQLAPALPLTEADSAQLQQVVMNLLINAGESIGEKPGTVTVSTSLRTAGPEELGTNYVGHPLTPGDYVCLEVSDTGCGMSPETLARIFDPFFSTKATGRGLGLSALLGIVRSHRGAVRVQSRIDQGTTFTVLFPLAAARPKGQSRPKAVAARLHGSTVLVVDDEDDIREVVQAVLESRGARVLTAADGPQAIEQFRAHADEVDLVLLDMTMPGLSGDAVFREIMSIRPDARVLMSSGYSEQETLARMDDERMAGFVHKPYTADALVEEIGAALQ